MSAAGIHGLDATAVAALATLVVLASAAGALLLAGQRSPSRLWLGLANAVAAGLMLGSGYVLAEAGQAGPALPGALGAVAGIGLLFGLKSAFETSELELNPTTVQPPIVRRKLYLTAALHAAAEGIALGIALDLNPTLGILMVAALAVHNVAEGAVLSAVLGGQGIASGPATLRTLLANSPTLPSALATFALAMAWPALTPWLLGFGTGALIYLVMVDLLPEAYQEAGEVSIALAVSATLGVIVGLEGSLT